MATKDDESLYCKKCGRVKKTKDFYKSNNLEKYPTGYLDLCKECLTIKVDNYDPDTYLWILQECDVPYIPKAWSACLDRYAGDKSKITSTNIIGGYLSKMKMVQYKKWRWKDTQYLQEKADREMEETMKRQGFEMAEIDQAITDSHTAVIPTGELEVPDLMSFEPEEEDYFAKQSGASDDDLVSDLTDEDRTYLRLKWGKAYKVDEWIRLEQFYQEMVQSYDVQGAGHEDILKMVCKTSLKANQLLDIGDVDGAQKMVKMYDGLMKSGKFTAAQNKAENGEFMDSISELAEICERDGFIVEFYHDKPNDKVDETLLDLKNYTHSLVTDEMNLGNLIENAVKEMAKQEAKEEDEDVEEELTYENIDELKDEDFEAFEKFLDEEREEDDE